MTGWHPLTPGEQLATIALITLAAMLALWLREWLRRK